MYVLEKVTQSVAQSPGRLHRCGDSVEYMYSADVSLCLFSREELSGFSTTQKSQSIS